MHQCRPIKDVYSCNVSRQNASNISSFSKFVKPLTVSKSVCSTIVSKVNICNVSIVTQQVKPLNVSKSIDSFNVRNRNVHNVNSFSQYIKLLNVSKSNCFFNVSKPVICKSSNRSICKKYFKDVHIFSWISSFIFYASSQFLQR